MTKFEFANCGDGYIVKKFIDGIYIGAKPFHSYKEAELYLDIVNKDNNKWEDKYNFSNYSKGFSRKSESTHGGVMLYTTYIQYHIEGHLIEDYSQGICTTNKEEFDKAIGI